VDKPDRYVPVDRDGAARAPEPRAQFMLRCLLSSRLDIGMPTSDESGNDEQDVNIYLAQLLGAYADPQYCLRVGPYISIYDSTVFERAQASPSARFKYIVYKANADHLLMSIGVFDNPTGRRPDAVRHAAMHPAEETYVGRGKTYYDFAHTYGQSVFGRTSAVCDVLGKLATGFERYVRLLGHLRGEYFDLVAPLGEGEMYHLQRTAVAAGVEALHNEFLDRLAEHRRDPTAETQARLRDVVTRIRRHEPDFPWDELH
jgi:hypothetical protein